MGYTIEFIIRSVPFNCDTCGHTATTGFEHLHRGTPVLEVCYLCGERAHGAGEAVERHKDRVLKMVA